MSHSSPARPYHLFQPLLYQVTTGILSEGEIAPTIREVLKRHDNVRVILGDVTHIDLQTRTVTSKAAEYVTATGYDSLIVAAGAGQSYFGNDHFAEFAPCMKTIDDALALRGRIFGSFEMAEIDEDAASRRRWMSFVVVGGGPTGVEMAGQLIELSRRSMRRNFSRIDPCTARVILLEAGPALLPAYGARLSRRTSRGPGASRGRGSSQCAGGGRGRRRCRGGAPGRHPSPDFRLHQDLGRGRQRVTAGSTARARRAARQWVPAARSRYCPTAPCPGIRRSSWSAT